ncbi:hypothetical protein CBS101457_006032 [Exobasidium rhododendri]|nr:hypothetical protein CBS101457_006032 [Exobasidium rhododendri]
MQHQPHYPTSALAAAISPPVKQLYSSGYPSPPSSGRIDGSDEGIGPCQVSGKVDGSLSKEKAFATIPERSPAHLASATPPGSSDDESGREEEEIYDDDDDDDEGEALDAASVSSPSTSVATHFPNEAAAAASVRSRSPYIECSHNKRPIRDSPNNPFLQGGPADLGFSGPKRNSRRREACPPRERGRMTYVFRGQRVTYADPYASDSDDDGVGPSTRGCMVDRLQPKLLFPSAGKATIVPSRGSDDFKRSLAPSKMKSTFAPTLDMAVERQNRLSSTKKTNNIDLLERLDRAGWSDSDDEDTIDNDNADRPIYQRKNRQNITTDLRDIVEDDDYDEEMREAEEDINPFLMPAIGMASASFLDKLQQSQKSSFQARISGVVRSNQASGHRFNPYGRQTRVHAPS